MSTEKLSFEDWKEKQPSDKMFEWGSAYNGEDGNLTAKHIKKRYSELTEAEKKDLLPFLFSQSI